MSTLSIQPIVFSYNLPDETDRICSALSSEGFDDFLVVDNGSDKAPPSKYANFLLPKNIRFSGQARMALLYCMDYFPSDYYWLLGTNVGLFEGAHYAGKIQRAIGHVGNEVVGLLSPAIVGGNANSLTAQKFLGNEGQGYVSCDPLSFQLIGTVVSHHLLEICRKEGVGFFNLDLYRGHGVDMELCYTGLKNGLWPIVDYSMQIEWLVNLTQSKNVDVESREEYHTKAGREYRVSFEKKYGNDWRWKFFSVYKFMVNQKNNFNLTHYIPDLNPYDFENVSKLDKLRYKLKLI